MMSVKVNVLVFVLLSTLCCAFRIPDPNAFKEELETERASLLTRCFVAEEQVTRLQEYIDTQLKKYFKEMADLIKCKKDPVVPRPHSYSDYRYKDENGEPVMLWGK